MSSIRYHVDPSDPRFSGEKRFDLFHGEAINCPPHERALEFYRNAHEQGTAILVVSARKEMWALPTLLWLREHGIEHDELYMRRNNDDRKDVEVKRDILHQIRRDGYRPEFAVDDNPAIIRLWIDYGIRTHIIPGWRHQH